MQFPCHPPADSKHFTMCMSNKTVKHAVRSELNFKKHLEDTSLSASKHKLKFPYEGILSKMFEKMRKKKKHA